MTARHLALVGLLAAAPLASARTITVNTAADVVDVDPQTATVDDLPGPDGRISFSEAMIASNNTPGRQTVGFAIPPAEWSLQFLYPGCAVLQSTVGFHFRAYDEVTIDGTTQTEYSGDTNPDGWEVVIHAIELYLNADDCTLTGFHSTNVTTTMSRALVTDNSGTMNVTVFGGGESVVSGNRCGTIKIDRSSGNTVVGNTTQRIRVLGGGPADPAAGNVIGGPGAADRNVVTGYGTWNSEGMPAGAAIQLAWADGTLIENNSIGTTPDGLAQGNLACTMGIAFQNENHGVVVRDNRIAGILGHGMGPHHAGQLFGWAIYFWGNNDDIELAGNTIGLDANGQPTLGSVRGVDVDNTAFYTTHGVRIADCVIAGHIFEGVRVSPSGTLRLSRNAIRDNGWLDIDLIPTSFASGVSPNDPLDADVGGNGVQNFPVLAAAARSGGAVHVTGTLASTPSDAFVVELFVAPSCDDSGHGPGAQFVGDLAVVTDAAGDAAIDATLPASIPDGWIMTATATRDANGATSEFSACIPVTGTGLGGDLDGDGLVGFGDLLLLLADWGACGASCPADLDGSGAVDFGDLLLLLAAWS